MKTTRDTSRRVLVLRNPAAQASAAWKALDRLLPEADRASDSFEAAGLLREKAYDLVLADSALADSILPGGSFFGLLGALITHQRNPTVAVEVCLPEGPHWVRLIQAGEFDPEAEPMKPERFYCWLEDWLEKSSASERAEAA